MATLSVPPVLTSPRDDAMALYRAFKGNRFIVFFLLTFFGLIYGFLRFDFGNLKHFGGLVRRSIVIT